MGLLDFCEKDHDQGEVEEVRSNLHKGKMLAERLATRVEDVLALAKADMESGELETVSLSQRIDEAWDAVDTKHPIIYGY